MLHFVVQDDVIFKYPTVCHFQMYIVVLVWFRFIHPLATKCKTKSGNYTFHSDGFVGLKWFGSYKGNFFAPLKEHSMLCSMIILVPFLGDFEIVCLSFKSFVYLLFILSSEMEGKSIKFVDFFGWVRSLTLFFSNCFFLETWWRI